MKKVSYSLETWDHSKLWFAKNWWFLFGITIGIILCMVDAIMVGLRQIQLNTFFIILVSILLLQNIVLIPGILSERIRTYGNVDATLMDDGKIKFDCKKSKYSTVEVSTSKMVKPNSVVPFLGFILAQEKWSNYVFMGKEAAIELGI